MYLGGKQWLRWMFAGVCAGGFCVANAADQTSGNVSSSSASVADFRGGFDGWQLTLGKEFPGAQAALSLEPEGAENKNVLRLEGYFAFGGNYVGIDRSFDVPRPLTGLMLRLYAPGLQCIVVRVTGGNGQVHQQAISLREGAGWQEVFIRDFAPVGRNHYLTWGGGAEGKGWDARTRRIAIIVDRGYLATKRCDKQVLLLDEIRLLSE